MGINNKILCAKHIYFPIETFVINKKMKTLEDSKNIFITYNLMELVIFKGL